MQTRRLGRTGLTVGEIGLGTEYLLDSPAETVTEVVRTAVQATDNACYIDLLYNHDAFLDRFAPAVAPVRDCSIVAVHWGCGEKGGRLVNVRDQDVCRRFFENVIHRPEIGYADVALLMMVDSLDEYHAWVPQALDTLEDYRRRGLARHLGISTHVPEVGVTAVESGDFDVIMFPVNVSSRYVTGTDILFGACVQNDVALVAMKPYGGGRLLSRNTALNLHMVQSGGQSLSVKKVATPKPMQLLDYVLAQPGVSSVVPGVRDIMQLSDALAYVEAPAAKRSHARLLETIRPQADGECVYCNHCQPCRAGIDIAKVTRLYEQAIAADNPSRQRRAYERLETPASACLDCGDCLERCPYHVDAPANMRAAAAFFER